MKRLLLVFCTVVIMLGLRTTGVYADVREVSDYGNLVAALGDAQDSDDTVKLMADINMENGYVISEGKVTLDLNGHKLTCADDCSPCFQINSDAEFILTDSSVEGTGVITRLPSMVCDLGGCFMNLGSFTMKVGCIKGFSTNGNGYPGGALYNNGTATIEGGKIESCSSDLGGAIYSINESLTISGGKISGCNAGTQGGAIFCASGDFNISGGKITECSAGIDGGGIYNYKGTLTVAGAPEVTGNTVNDMPNNAQVMGSPSDASFVLNSFSGVMGIHLPDGFIGEISGDRDILGSLYSDSNPSKVLSKSSSGLVMTTPVASVGDVYYDSLAAAFTSAPDGSEIDILADITDGGHYNFEDRSYTLDLNGHTITSMNDCGGYYYINNRSGKSFTIKDSSASGTGSIKALLGIVYADGENAVFNLESGTLEAVSYDGYHSVVLVQGKGKFNMTGGCIKGNASVNTFGVKIDNGTFEMSGGKIADFKGGGVFVSKGTGSVGQFKMTGGQIINCEAENGGGVYVQSGTFEMAGGTIEECRVKGEPNYGGGVYVNAGGTFKMTDGVISGCSAEANGGGVYLGMGSLPNVAELIMTGGTIKECTAQNGAGIYVNGYGSVAFKTSGCLIKDCTASEKGGGLYFYESTAALRTGSITGCKAKLGGGVYATFSSGVSLLGTSITGCQALGPASNGGYGGGIYLDNSKVLLSGPSTVKNNTSPTGADDIYYKQFEFTSTSYKGLLLYADLNDETGVGQSDMSEGVMFGIASTTASSENKILRNAAPSHLIATVSGTAIVSGVTYNCLYWDLEKNPMTFNVQGHGTAPEVQNVRYDKTAEEPAAPSEAGFFFEGWFKEPACTHAWNFDTDTVSAPVTVYAKWSAIADNPIHNASFTYDKTQKTGVTTGAGYTLTGVATATNAGTYSATAKLLSGYVWSDGSRDDQVLGWTIEKADIATATVASVPEQTYTGSAVKPEPSVVLGGNTLVKGVDFTYSYDDNVAVCDNTAKVTVTGIGNYQGSQYKTFTIWKRVQKPVTGALTYNGTEQVFVSENVAYTIAGTSKAKVVSPYSITLTLVDDYAWTDGTTDVATVTWSIVQADLSTAVITSVPNQYYTGGEVRPEPVVTINGNPLTKNVDFTYSYENNTEKSSSAVVKITGIDNCTGTNQITFTIVDKPVYVGPSDYSGAGGFGGGAAGGAAQPSKTEEKKTKEPAFRDKNGNPITNSLVETSKGLVFVDDEGQTVTKSVVTAADIITGEKKQYYVGKNGLVVKNKLVTLPDGSRIFATEDGSLAKSSMVTAPNGRKYYVGKNGKVVKNKVVKFEGKKYFANKYGVIRKNALVKDKKGVQHYCTKDGSFATSKWVTVKGVKYWCSKYGNITKKKK